MTDQAVIPNPGSPEAMAQGCKCPVVDNGHGHGRDGPPLGPTEGMLADSDPGEDLAVFGERVTGLERPAFVLNLDCPLHGGNDWLDEDDGDRA